MAETVQQRISALEEELARLRTPGAGRLASESLVQIAAPRNSVTVRVPATSANMGPGFDCVGMALDMWSELTLTRNTEADAPMLTITCEGEGSESVPRDDSNLVVVAVKAAFRKAGAEMVPLHFHCVNRIPFGRGLGSSSAAVVSGLVAGLALCGRELKVFGEGALMHGGTHIEPEELLQLASQIEGHPDNVCPAIYGGIQLGIQIAEGQWRSCRVNCPTDLQLVAFISDSVGKTSELRSVLSDTVTRAEAVFNIGRTAFLVNALNTNKLYDLRWGTQDALHQPQRAAAVYHHIEPMIKAGMAAGAHGVYLSGAGPTVLALTSGAAGDTFSQLESERTEQRVAKAMLEAAASVKHTGRVFISRPVLRGAYISKADPPFSSGLIHYPGDL